MTTYSLFLHLLAACLAIVCAGCEGAANGPADFAPPDVVASRAALVVALDAWQAGGRRSGVIVGAKPAVGIVDSARVDRPLIGYEIVGPLMPVGKARPFAVNLVLDAPREAVATSYLILGLDPLWVYRRDDFDRMLHWEHGMDPKPEAPAR